MVTKSTPGKSTQTSLQNNAETQTHSIRINPLNGVGHLHTLWHRLQVQPTQKHKSGFTPNNSTIFFNIMLFLGFFKFEGRQGRQPWLWPKKGWMQSKCVKFCKNGTKKLIFQRRITSFSLFAYSWCLLWCPCWEKLKTIWFSSHPLQLRAKLPWETPTQRAES